MSTLEVWRRRGIGINLFWLIHFVDGVVTWEGDFHDWKKISRIITDMKSGSLCVQDILRRPSGERIVELLNENRALYDVMLSIGTGQPEGN